MPDIKHYFRSGKMNKDLDERLVPNGEYRDAMNVQMSTSDGDDVGTIQNVAGNTKITGKTFDSNKKVITSNWSGFGLTNAKCIGSVVNTENDRIYWFIKADEADCIAEYDDIKGIISPVLVDANNILNFTSDQYITGINVLEGILFWTDDKSEPKKIDIEVFKSGCADNFTTHTKYTGQKILPSNLSSASNFLEEHITSARLAPMSMPTLVMSSSTRGGVGTGTSTVIISNATNSTFTDTEGIAKAAGTSLSLTFSPLPNWQVGDIITCTSTYEELGQQDTLEIKLLINSISQSNTFTCTIQSIPVEIPYTNLIWEAILSEEGVLFEKKFVRFAYRWKYYSGEYSTFSPFSEVAFLPDTFEYLSTDGYNDGMINNLRQLTINITESRPVDVEEVDILYKESNNNNVYVVDTLKYNSDGSFPTEYKLESEIITKTVASNQMIRPWDNVPKKAKAQEITANRLIYGNYLQNYDIEDFNLPDISMLISQASITTVKEPELSIKSLRTYQTGVVYIDKYNRQSPVLTSDSASKQTGKNYAPTVNSISVTLNNQPPSWATHFKYYVKETSNEYYNLAMDRYYLAEDGNVWLSFPSSERNKVDEETYLILKKKHDSDDFVATKSRYKILDISNDAPDFLKLKQRAVGNGAVKARSSNIPQIGSVSFEFRGPNPVDNPSFSEGFSSDSVIQLAIGGVKTDKYKVVSGGPTGEEDGTENNFKHIYKLTLAEPIKTTDTMVSSISSGTQFEVILFEEKFERKAEFYGRFFVKVNRDSNFDTNIIASFPEEDEQFGISDAKTLFGNAPNTGPNDSTSEASWFDTNARHNKINQSSNGHPKLGSNNMTIYYTGSPKSGDRSFDKENTINNFLKSIKTTDTLFRFKGSQSGALSEIYKVKGCTITYKYRRNGRKRLFSSKRRQYNIQFEHYKNGTPYEDIFVYPSSGSAGNFIDEIQILQNVVTTDVEVLTSNNPAIWETEPKEAVDLDLYYETGLSRPIAQHGQTHILDFKNCYSFGNGVESDRINDDFNAPRIGKGVKVSTVLDEPYKEERRKNGLIFSGIFNSTSGVNRLNQFIQGEAITKDLNPHYGSIQKLHARNTDLIVFCEDKVLKVLANKDALFEAGGNAQLTATNRVLGQSIPFIGEYGISLNPESFADYAYRVYFVDKARGAVLRLSRDGLTAISEHGMRDYFKDTLAVSTLILGSYDDSKGLYNLTLNDQTVSFDEKVRGWPSFKSFIPEAAVALNNKYYSIKNGELWVHTNPLRNTFYGADAHDSSVTFLINEMPEVIKGFKTLNYGGSRSRVYTNNYDAGNNYSNPTSTNTKGWYCEYITTDQQEGFIKEFKKKEGRYYNFIKGDATTLSNLDSQEFSVQGIGKFTGNLAGDVALSDKTVTVSLTGIANTTNPGATFDVEAGSEIHETKTHVFITITPDTGSSLTASDLSFNATGHTYIHSVAFVQNGLNVQAKVNFKDGVNMPTSNLAINLAVVGDGVLNKYKLTNLNLVDQSDGNIATTITYNGSGNNETANPSGNQLGYKAEYGTQNTVAVVKFNLNNAYNFKKPPSFKITIEDNDPESFYVVTHQDKDSTGADITIGVGGKTLEDVDQRWFTVQYKFPAQDTDKNEIVFNAESVLENDPENNKITGYNVVGGNTVGRYAQTKEVKVFGAVGADFRVKNCTTSTGSTSGSSTTLTLTAVNNDLKTGMLASWGSSYKGKIRVARVSDTSKFKEYEVTNVVDGTGYWKLTVQNHSGSVSPLSTFPQGDDVVVSLFDENDNVYSGFNAKTYDFEQNTSDSDPGAGKVKFNQTALQNVTAVYIDEVDKTSTNLDAQFTTLMNTPISDSVLVSAIDGVTVTLASAKNISSNTTLKFTQWWNGTTFVSSETDLEIPSTGFYSILLPFFETSTTKRYYLEIEPKSPTTLLNPLQGNVYNSSGVVQNPFYINQFVDVDITLGMHQVGSDFTITSSDVSKTYTAGAYPVEGSDFSVFNLSLTATATSNITKTKDPEVDDWSNYVSTTDDVDIFANNFELDYQIPIVDINNNTSPKTITITGKMFVNKYGTDDLVSDLAINNFASVASSGGGVPGGFRMYTPTITGAGGGLILGQVRASYSDGTFSGTNAKNVAIGTANNTNLTSGTGVIYGNFYGNGVNDITLTISASNSAAMDNLNITKGSLVGVAPSQDLHYTWTGQTKEVIDASSDMTFNIHVALSEEP